MEEFGGKRLKWVSEWMKKWQIHDECYVREKLNSKEKKK